MQQSGEPSIDRWTHADLYALVVGLVGIAALVFVARSAYLRGDDWMMLSVVEAPGFGVDDLFVPYGSHLMPLGQAVLWMVSAVSGPAPWWPLVLTGAAFVAGGLLLTWLTIRRLVAPVPGAVVAFAVGVWSCAITAAVLWPAPAMFATPLFLVVAAAVYVYVRGRLGHGPRRWRSLVVLVVVCATLTVETWLLIPVLLFVIEAAWFSSVRKAWRSARGLWLTLAGIAVVYAALFAYATTRADSLPGAPARVDLIVEGAIEMVYRVLPTMMVGGPWVWRAATAPSMETPGMLLLPVAIAAWAVIWFGRRAGWRTWMPLFTMMAITLAAIAVSRLGAYGPTVLLNPYQHLALVAVLPVCLALGYLPSALPLPQKDRAAPRGAVLVAAVVVLLAGLIASSVGYAKVVPRSPSRQYLASARQSLREPVMNTSSPRRAFEVFWYSPPFDTARNTMALAGVDGQWVEASHEPFMLGADGTRVPMRVAGAAFALPSSCVDAATGAVLTAPEPRDPHQQAYAMSYRADAATAAVVTLGDSSLRVPLRPGANTVYFVGLGAPDEVVVTAPGTCVSELVIGEAVPG